MRNGGVAASAATNSTYNARRAGGGGIVDDGGFQTGDDAPRPVKRADKAPPKIGALLRAHLLSERPPRLGQALAAYTTSYIPRTQALKDQGAENNFNY